MNSGCVTASGLFLTVVCAFSAPAREGEAAPNLVASENISGLTIPKGTHARVIADFQNHQLASPTSMAFGSSGELYIAETHRLRHGVADNRSHLYWFVDDISSRTTADRLKMHEKWQNQNASTALAFLTEKSELLRVLSDPNTDGVFRKQNVFASGFNDVLDGVASGVFEYEGTVFLACIPKLYALRDTNGNGEADVRDVIQDGFGVHVSLSGHDLNGFILGADGRIYGTMGDRGFNASTREGRQYNLHDEGFVFRFDPDGSNFEVIHSGLRNPKEIAFDELGNIISVDNNCDHGDKARVVYIVDGADSGWHMGHQGLLSFHKQIGMENKPPAKWMADVDYSWDGKVTVTDFIGGWESHLAGRVYTITADQPYRAKEAGEVATFVKEGFEHRSANNLAALMFHPDMRIRVRAQLALSRKAEGLAMFTKAAEQTKNRLARLHGVWGLGVIARRGSAVLPGVSNSHDADPALRESARLALISLLNDKDTEVRAQAVKVLGESGLKADGIPFEKLIGDNSPRVQLFATIAAGRMNANSVIGSVLTMLENTSDPYLRHAGSYALYLLETPENLAALKANPSARIRMAAVIALRRAKSPALAAYLTDSDEAVVHEAIRSINDQNIAEVRPQVGALLETAATRPRPTMIWRRMLHSAFRAGDEASARLVLKVALDPKTPDESRSEAFRLLSEWTIPHPADQSTGRYSPLPVRDPELIGKVLGGSITELVQVDGKYLEAALALVQQNQLDLSSVTDGVLRNLIESDHVPGSARVEALDFYIARKPADLTQMISTLADGKDDHLVIGALRHLMMTSPQSALDGLARAVAAGSAYRQQQAWKLAADLSAPGASQLFVSSLTKLQKQNGISPAALELLEAAGKRSEPEVKSALAAFQSAQSASTDPLAAWLTTLEGGNPETVAKVFESHPAGQCMRCHAGGHGGGDAGPDLADIGLREDRRYMLESLVLPGAKVTMGYGIASATLKGGKTVGGIVIDDTPTHVDFDSAGTIMRVARKDIESMTPPVSSMPPMNFMLSAAEIRDVVAWLSEQKRKVRNQKKRPDPVMVTP